VAQQGNYTRSGFVLAHRNVRFGGTPQIAPPQDHRLQAVGPHLLDGVLSYDQPFFAAPREAFLRCWLRPDARKAIAFVEDGTIKGYGVARACRSGYKIGPLFANAEREAHLPRRKALRFSWICLSRTRRRCSLQLAMAWHLCSRLPECTVVGGQTCCCPKPMGSQASSWAEPLTFVEEPAIGQAHGYPLSARKQPRPRCLRCVRARPGLPAHKEAFPGRPISGQP
jgi:hypothetical protein